MGLKRLPQVRCFLLDMDGTVYLGGRLLPGASAFLAFLEQEHIPFYFLTNNSSRSAREYATKLHHLGLEFSEEKIFTSGEATAIFLHKQKAGARLYVVGTPALAQELERHGFAVVQEDPDYAVLGFDTTLTYEKLRRLCALVAAGVPYIATHPDVNCPTEDGFMPDIGAMIELVAASTGRRPDVIVGKPHPPIVAALAEKTGFAPQEIAMVGDRLYTDIAMGQAGLTTVLVLSGETRAAQVADSPFQPDLVVDDLADLLDVLQREGGG